MQQLQSYVTAGLTCSQIAAEIGVTRNAVIGKIHRLGLSTGGRGRRPAAGQRMRDGRGQRRATAVADRADPARGRAMAPERRAVRDQPTKRRRSRARGAARCSNSPAADCRWPLGDPGKADFGFCGNDAIAGFSYCAGHARLAYRLPSGRRA